MKARHLAIHGRVQGVGFREALRAEALRLGLCGWVRNRADGSVEALVQGGEESVAQLVAWARHGPPLARVVRLVETPAEVSHLPPAFSRLPTA